MVERHGVEYSFQSPTLTAKARETSKLLHDDPNYTNREQSAETMRNKSPEEKAEIRRKTVETNIQRFGVPVPMQCDEVKEKSKQTNMDKIGVPNPFMLPNFKEIRDSRCLELYDTVSFTEQYVYYQTRFDSSWELAVWIYCIDHGIPIVREPIKLGYIDSDGNNRCYIPDFMINGQLVEVKGSQFFNEDGTMKSAYHTKKDPITGKYVPLTDEEVINADYNAEQKHKCGLANGVVFWRQNDIQPYLDYCNMMYPGWQFMYRKNNPYNPSYWVYFKLPTKTGVTPYDIDQTQQYAPVSGQGITPFDIK